MRFRSTVCFYGATGTSLLLVLTACTTTNTPIMVMPTNTVATSAQVSHPPGQTAHPSFYPSPQSPVLSSMTVPPASSSPLPALTPAASNTEDGGASPEETEKYLSSMLHAHLIGIEGGSRNENVVSVQIVSCTVNLNTTMEERGGRAGKSSTKAVSALKDVVDVSMPKSDRISLVGSPRSTEVIFTGSGTPPNQTGTLTLVLDTADAAAQIMKGFRKIAGLCGGRSGPI